MSYPRVIENLIEQLTKLPGVGRRSAERMVFWLLDHTGEEAERLAGSITELKERLRFCRSCNSFTESEICPICSDQTRDGKVVCVVENPKDAVAIEKTGQFKGLYFVLLGTVIPSEGQGLEDLNLHKLIRRVMEEGVEEIVIATDADMEGELTALHLIKVLKPLGVRISRIGVGLPAGGAVEFADMSTLTMSLKSRRSVLEPDAQGAPASENLA